MYSLTVWVSKASGSACTRYPHLPSSSSKQGCWNFMAKSLGFDKAIFQNQWWKWKGEVILGCNFGRRFLGIHHPGKLNGFLLRCFLPHPDPQTSRKVPQMTHYAHYATLSTVDISYSQDQESSSQLFIDSKKVNERGLEFKCWNGLINRIWCWASAGNTTSAHRSLLSCAQ